MVCVRFGGVHVSALPFLKFVVMRRLFRWLRFELSRQNGSRLPCFFWCVCAGQTKHVHIYEFSPQYLFHFALIFGLYGPTVWAFQLENCVYLFQPVNCVFIHFSLCFYEQFWRHFRLSLKCVCSVIIQSFLSLFPRKWWLFILGNVGLPDLCFIICFKYLLTSSSYFQNSQKFSSSLQQPCFAWCISPSAQFDIC